MNKMYQNLTCDDLAIIGVLRKNNGTATQRNFRYNFDADEVDESSKRLEDVDFIRVRRTSSRVSGQYLSYVGGGALLTLTPKGWAYVNFESFTGNGVLQ